MSSSARCSRRRPHRHHQQQDFQAVRQRASACLTRIRRLSGNRHRRAVARRGAGAGAGAGTATGAGSAASGNGGGDSAIPGSSSGLLRSRSARVNRAHTQLVSQLRATFRWIACTSSVVNSNALVVLQN